jgi:hypothetical protein
MLGWDSPSYIELTKELFKNGELQTITTWSYPQLYVQLLAVFGYTVRNLTMAERTLPLFFAFLGLCASFLITLRISTNVHIAGLAVLLQAFSISFLKIVSDNNRNLMALSLTFVTMLMVEYSWKRQPRVRDYVVLTALTLAIAMTQFETFGVLSLTLMISALLTRRRQHVVVSSLSVAIPAILMVVAFPNFFLTYFQTTIQTPRQTLGLADLFYWIGGSGLLLGVLALGYAYAFTKWRRSGNILSLLIFVWSTVLLGIFAAVYVGLLPVQSEFGVRALLVIPSYVLISLGVLLVWAVILTPLQHRRLSLWRFDSRGLMTALIVILVVTLLVANGSFGASESGVYFNPYISTTAFNKMVLGTNYVQNQSWGIPIFVFYGSIGYATLYRNYIGELMGENFAYYGTLGNLLQLRPTVSNASDQYQSKFESSLSQNYLAEMLGNITGPSQFVHNSHITDNSTLNSHTMVFITPELDNDVLPPVVTRFLIGNGISIVPPGGLADPKGTVMTSAVTTSQGNAVSGSPILFYPPTSDIFSLLATTLSFVVAVWLVDYLRHKRTPLYVETSPTIISK